jgi:hypothetical protein
LADAVVLALMLFPMDCTKVMVMVSGSIREIAGAWAFLVFAVLLGFVFLVLWT